MPLYRIEHLQQFAAVNILADPGEIPGPVVIPQCVQTVMNWQLPGGKVGRNVLYGKYSGTFIPTPASCDTFKAALVNGANWSSYALTLAPSVSLLSVTMRDVNVADQAIVSSTSPAAPGTGTGNAMPNEVAAVLGLRTEKAGRANRGRVFLPGFVNVAVGVNNEITPAVTGPIAAFGNNIAAAFQALSLVWVLGQKARAAYTSPITGRQFPARPAFGLPIVSRTVDNHWDTQRRRGL